MMRKCMLSARRSGFLDQTEAGWHGYNAILECALAYLGKAIGIITIYESSGGAILRLLPI